MTMTDPIAAMLTRIRNALAAKKEKVSLPASNMRVAIAKILKEEGYILEYKKVDDQKQGVLDLTLKYSLDGQPVITSIKRVSKPSLRRYTDSGTIKPVIGGRGISILTTSKGVMTGDKAQRNNVGGEVMCEIW